MSLPSSPLMAHLLSFRRCTARCQTRRWWLPRSSARPQQKADVRRKLRGHRLPFSCRSCIADEALTEDAIKLAQTKVDPEKPNPRMGVVSCILREIRRP